MELRPTDFIIVECMAGAGAIASVKERKPDSFERLSMAKIVDAIADAGRLEDFFGGDLPERSKQVDRLRSQIKRLVKEDVIGEGEPTQGTGKGYYVFEENVGEGALKGAVESAGRDERSATPPPDDERMARPAWAQKLSQKVYREWVSWAADFTARKLSGGKAEANGIDLPEDFTGDDLCEMWVEGAARGRFTETKLLKELQARFPVSVAK